MKSIKKIFLLVAFTFILFSGFCGTARFQEDDLTLTLKYTDTISPGDGLFVRMTVQTPKNHKRPKVEFEKKALLQLYRDKKKIEQSSFYIISKKKNNATTELLAGIPLSTWLKNDIYTAKIFLSISENETKEFSIPLNFENRTFFEETIELNAQNTAIKTDDSPKRTTQIEKLNTIINTISPSDIYNLKSMVSPTTSTRYTAYCGDRRTYAYSNGKSSTSLHYGNDYGIPTGTPVTACGTGKVVMAENRISTGFSIVIEHLPGLYSLYYHLSELSVNEGDMVKPGDIIGKSGATGLATGPHLHWEMRLNGAAVRPEFFMTNFAFEED